VFFYQAGMDGVWTEFMSLLDAKGETRAFKTLGLTSSATLPEVKKVWFDISLLFDCLIEFEFFDVCSFFDRFCVRFVQACRALRLENHPDKNLDAEAAAQAKFIEINEACDTLFKMFDERDGKAADEARQQQDDHQQQQQQKQREKRDMEHRVRAEQAAAVEKKRKEQAAREAVNDFEAAKEKFESAKQKRERLEAAAAAASWSQSTQKDSNLNNAARTKSKAGKNSQYN
jgi:flagellar biosynthesis GTPase FlhF